MAFFYRKRTSFPMISRMRIVGAIVVRCMTADSYGRHLFILYDKVGWTSLEGKCNKHWYLLIYNAPVRQLPPYISMMLDWNFGSFSKMSLSQMTYDLCLRSPENGLTLESQPLILVPQIPEMISTKCLSYFCFCKNQHNCQ